MTDNGRTTSLRQLAYEQIKWKIVSLELAPGSVIDEAGLRAELELGRTPIREALQRLALEKLVVIIPRRGMFVADIGVMDLQRLFEARVALESMAARLAAQRGSVEHWQRMESVLAHIPDDTQPSQNQAVIAIDQACHELIYEAIDNEFLRDTLITMYALSLRLWYFALSKIGSVRGAVLEHVAILKALAAGDEDEAAYLMEQHIKLFQEEIQAVMLGTVQPGQPG
jgi:DNA-binding GntR family transcriptional regulator